ncbi:MAG TPA: glycosyltransferase family 1 protein [Solirubrobacteraceae bacterium]|nr:glycosyltransferase family 1 protein [Solirubrobacteraceae bacterium]
MSRPSHIGVNAVFLRPPMAGIETYVRRLMPELAALRPRTRLSLFLGAEGARALAAEPWAEEVQLVTHPLLGVRLLSALSEVALLGRLASARGVDALNSVALTGPWWGRFAHVVTVGDMTWHLERASVSRSTGLVWRALVPRTARRADRVLTYSEAARRDIVSIIGVPQDRVDVVPLGPGSAEAAGAPDEPVVRERYDLGTGPVVLTVSGKRPSKNLARLVEAMARVHAERPDAVLVMPGAPTPHEQELRELADRLGVSERVRFPAFVPDADLEGLYRVARCFVFPSLYEGFGLPVLEAMRRGVPVACSPASSIPEVAGDAALYFDPLDPAQIADAIRRLLEDDALASRLTAAGRERQRAFSWRRTAEGTLECIDRAWRESYGPRA